MPEKKPRGSLPYSPHLPTDPSTSRSVDLPSRSPFGPSPRSSTRFRRRPRLPKARPDLTTDGALSDLKSEEVHRRPTRAHPGRGGSRRGDCPGLYGVRHTVDLLSLSVDAVSDDFSRVGVGNLGPEYIPGYPPSWAHSD